MNPNFIPLDAVSTRRFDLDSIQIASPCRADWDAMSGDDQVRHCKSCAKNVYNLSTLTRADAVRLIQETEGHLCVQLHRRTDGTILTADCTVGVSRIQKSSRAVRNGFAAGVAAILGVFGISAVRAADPAPTRTLGAPMMVDIGEMAPVMGKPMPIKGQPRLLMGRIVRPTTTKAKAVKKHATHTSNPAGKTGAARNRRHRR